MEYGKGSKAKKMSPQERARKEYAAKLAAKKRPQKKNFLSGIKAK